jgi:hypothetical protein
MLSGASTADYTELHRELIRFYGFQRAGTANGDPHNPFYDHAPYPHANDNHNGHALDGGWYDAGDFVKFGLPLGYSVYVLLKGYDVWPGAYDDRDSWDYTGNADGIPDILNEVKVASDYLLKAVIDENTIVMDVGNASRDHGQLSESGYQNAQRIPHREVYLADGADVPGLYAAALALMASLYAPYDDAYAQRCLTKARKAFTFCTTHQRVGTTVQKDWNNGGQPYYGTDTWADKMACGAIELYRATGEQVYLTWARDLMAQVTRHFYVLGYANCGDLAAFELYRQGETGPAGAWISDVNLAINRVVSRSGLLVTGAFVNSNWGVCRDAATAAFSAALAYMVKGDNQYRDFAFEQINWVAGFSPHSTSYITRYDGGPRHPHHRNDITLGGLLRGGIMSGPTPQGPFDPTQPENSTWIFSDVADKYTNTEVALDYNAGAIGTVAFIRYYTNPPPGLVRIEEPLKATPDMVDFNTTDAVAITMKLATTRPWTITLTGQNSGALKTLSGTGASVSARWSGDAGTGAFEPGEIVDVVYVEETVAEYHRSRAKTTLYIENLKAASFRADDVLVDDIDDGDTINELGGTWSAFSDQSEGIPGAASATPIIYISGSGKSDTKAVLARITASAGATHPYAGIKTSLAAGGSAVSIGPATSVVFDVKPADDEARFRVELEEPGFGGTDYRGAFVSVPSATWHRVRIAFTDMHPPAWSSRTAALNPDAIAAIRFVVQGENSTRLTIDNLHVENLRLGAAPVRTDALRLRLSSSARVRSSPGIIAYSPPAAVTGEGWSVVVFDMAGRRVYRRRLSPAHGGSIVRLHGLHPSPGTYLLHHLNERNGQPAPAMRCLVPPGR